MLVKPNFTNAWMRICLNKGSSLWRSLNLMKGSTIFLLVFLVGAVFLVGHAQSRFDVCKQQRQKTIQCVFQFD